MDFQIFFLCHCLFCSLGPAQVANVRVFAFRPNTDPMVITGLVSWDNMDFVDMYTISVTENGGALSNVSAGYCSHWEKLGA